MSKKNKKNQNNEAKAAQEEIQEKETLNAEQQANENKETADNDPEKRIAELEEQLEHEKSKYLFLMADLENFRKRTLKEKADLLKNGAESAMRDLLPVVDDLERAMDAINKGGDLDSLKEGVDLISTRQARNLTPTCTRL